jgi:hypothetical protein
MVKAPMYWGSQLVTNCNQLKTLAILLALISISVFDVTCRTARMENIDNLTAALINILLAVLPLASLYFL